MANYQSMLDSGDFSDITIICNGLKRPVHRVIISGQSPVFKAMCLGQFKEAETGFIDLSDHNIESVDLLLEYLYTGDYDDFESTPELDIEYSPDPLCSSPSTSRGTSSSSQDDQLTPEHRDPLGGQSLQTTNAVMYAFGERYSIGELKELARSKFSKTKYSKIYYELPSVIEVVYTTTPDSDRSLRDILKEICGPHGKALLTCQSAVDVILRVPTFGLDLLRAMAKERDDYLEKLQTIDHEAWNTLVDLEDVRIDLKTAHHKLAAARSRLKLHTEKSHDR